MIARPRRNGFTLIEVLLASTLVAAITAAVCSSLWSSLRSCERRRDRFDRETSLSTALRVVETDLGHREGTVVITPDKVRYSLLRGELDTVVRKIDS